MMQGLPGHNNGRMIEENGKLDGEQGKRQMRLSLKKLVKI